VTDATPEPDVPPESKRILDPLERISEVIFGVIMALSFTGSLSVASAGRAEVRTMLVGALGCNTAWGIVDGVMYVLGNLLLRNRNWLQLMAVRRAADPEVGRRILARGLPGSIGLHLQREELERLRSKIVSDPMVPVRHVVTGEDLLGAAGIFLLCFISTLPVALPFAIIQHPVYALRTSNLVAMGLLFLAGHRLGRFAGFAAWRFGFVMLGIGVVLVLVTLALGG